MSLSPARRWLRHPAALSVLVGASLAVLLALWAARPMAAPLPNIVFILADDLGYGDLGVYGQRLIDTPHIDRLAAEGVRFTDFYAGSTVCAPSRSVLMTGLHAGRTYIRGNAKTNLRPEDVTVAELLRKAGYTNGLVGKWGLGHEGSTGVPTRKGFHHFFGYLDQTHAHNYYPTFLVRNDSRVPLTNVVPDEGKWGQGVATVKREYSPDLMMDEAAAFLRRHKDEPFFLYLAHTLPHANNEATRATGFGNEIPDLGVYADRDWTAANKAYAAMVSRLDADVGRIMALLGELGIDERTVVFFSSDNGPHAEGGNDPEFFRSSGPLRGKKRDLYEGGIRVPMIVRWPGRAPAGVVSDHVGYFGDLMATTAALAGVPVPPGLDSISFLPAVLGQPARQRRHDYLYWEFYEGGSAQAVRAGRWKAIRQPMFDGALELYDLDADVAEQHDMAQKHPASVAEMRQFMERAHVPSPLWTVKRP